MENGEFLSVWGKHVLLISSTLFSNLFSSKNTINYFQTDILNSSDFSLEPKFLLRINVYWANMTGTEWSSGRDRQAGWVTVALSPGWGLQWRFNESQGND